MSGGERPVGTAGQTHDGRPSPSLDAAPATDWRDGSTIVPAVRHPPGMMPFLSLFLLLLAFFLMINSLSRLEVTRTQAILGSLSSTFRSADTLGLERKFGSASGPVIGAERLEETITDLLRTATGIDAFDVFRAGNTLTALFSLGDLFEGTTATPSAAAAELADLISGAVADEPADTRFEVTVVVGRAADLALPRAEAIGNALLEAGLGGERLAVGMDDGDPRRLQILLRVLTRDERGGGIVLRGGGNG